MENYNRLYIGGPHGVGKNTVIDAFASRHPAFTPFQTSQLFMQLCDVETRADLAALSREKKDHVSQTKLFPLITENPQFLMDGHFDTIDYEPQHVDGFALLLAGPDTILKYRASDTTRSRELSPEAVTFDIQAELGGALTFAKQYQIPVHLVANNRPVQAVVTDFERLIFGSPNPNGSFGEIPRLTFEPSDGSFRVDNLQRAGDIDLLRNFSFSPEVQITTNNLDDLSPRLPSYLSPLPNP